MPQKVVGWMVSNRNDKSKDWYTILNVTRRALTGKSKRKRALAIIAKSAFCRRLKGIALTFCSPTG